MITSSFCLFGSAKYVCPWCVSFLLILFSPHAHCSSRCIFPSHISLTSLAIQSSCNFFPAMEISLRSTQKCDYALRIYILFFSSFPTFPFGFHLICFSQPKLHGKSGILAAALRLCIIQSKSQKVSVFISCTRANTQRIDYFSWPICVHRVRLFVVALYCWWCFFPCSRVCFRDAACQQLSSQQLFMCDPD